MKILIMSIVVFTTVMFAWAEPVPTDAVGDQEETELACESDCGDFMGRVYEECLLLCPSLRRRA